MAFVIRLPFVVANGVHKASGTTNLFNKSKAGGIGFDTADSTELKYNQAGTVRTVCNLDGTQTLTNKTFTTPTITGALNSDTKFCTTQFDAVTGTTGVTLTNVVGLTGFSVVASGVYRFQIFINGVATANSGHKIGLKLTTTTLTSANYGAQALLASTTAYTQGTTATDQMSLHAATTATIGVHIRGRLVINAAGTIAVQAAQNAAHADTTSVYVGSWATFTRVS
jgi:hypothetical protein